MGQIWMNENVAEYTLEEIEVGQKKKFEVVVTESLLNKFAELSGDYSPLHMDDKYARSTDFKQRVCHGILLVSFFSRLVGMYLPGKNALYFSQSLKFISPCFINDKIQVEGEVLDKSIASRMITLKTTIVNNSGQCLVDGQAKIVVRK
jgi:acyl dehydratase